MCKTAKSLFSNEERDFFASLVSFKGNESELEKLVFAYIQWANTFGVESSSAKHIAELARNPKIRRAAAIAADHRGVERLLEPLEESLAKEARALIYG